MYNGSMKLLYKLLHSVVPCIFITLCIGFCYAFSIFTPYIAEHIGRSTIAVHFAFCLNIFFLGMGAGLFGRLVENKIKSAALLSTILLFSGLCIAAIAVQRHSLMLLYIGIGLFAGLAEGIGYVTPVKNLILWFGKGKHKGLVAAISIISFGLGSTLCSSLFNSYFSMFDITGIFYAYAITYLIPMVAGTLLIRKPKFATTNSFKCEFSYVNTIKDTMFWKYWTFMFLNISMGLILIGSCASILREVNIERGTIIVVMMLCGIFNGCGRLVFPAISDFMKNRINIWILIASLEILVMIPCACIYALIPFSIILINALYGSGFSTLPSLLSDHYGNKNLSTIHGLVLTSWGIASLFAYVCTAAIAANFNSYYYVVFILLAIYALNAYVAMSIKSKLVK